MPLDAQAVAMITTAAQSGASFVHMAGVIGMDRSELFDLLVSDEGLRLSILQHRAARITVAMNTISSGDGKPTLVKWVEMANGDEDFDRLARVRSPEEESKQVLPVDLATLQVIAKVFSEHTPTR